MKYWLWRHWPRPHLKRFYEIRYRKAHAELAEVKRLMQGMTDAMQAMKDEAKQNSEKLNVTVLTSREIEERSEKALADYHAGCKALEERGNVLLH